MKNEQQRSAQGALSDSDISTADRLDMRTFAMHDDPEGNIPIMREAAKELRSLQAENERLHETVRDVGGRTTEFAVVNRLEAIARNMREGNAPEALKNLSAACATLAAYSIANGRWAVLEGKNVNSVTAENQSLQADLNHLRAVTSDVRNYLADVLEGKDNGDVGNLLRAHNRLTEAVE